MRYNSQQCHRGGVLQGPEAALSWAGMWPGDCGSLELCSQPQPRPERQERAPAAQVGQSEEPTGSPGEVPSLGQAGLPSGELP